MRAELPQAALEALPAGCGVLCAVSGGRDSMVLLHLLLHNGFAVTAAHFHHGIRGAAADRDAAFVRQICGAWGVPLVMDRGDAPALARREGLSLEEAARRLRYDFLEEALERTGCAFLVTGHHLADQAETILFNLARGAGMDGLRGMPLRRGRLLRPLLRVPPEALDAYAAAHQIPFVEDETNQDLAFARNRIRRQVLPALEQIDPRALEAIARTGALLAEESGYLDRAAEAALPPVTRTETGLTLPLAAFRAMDPVLRRRAVRLLLERLPAGRRDITAAHIRAAADLLPGKAIDLPGGVRVSARRGVLRLDRCPPAGERTALRVPGETAWGPLRLICSGPAGDYAAAPWSPKDRLDGRTVKRILRDTGTPDHLRSQCPVLFLDGKPIAVCGPFGCVRGRRCPPAFRVSIQTEKGEKER